MFVSAFVLCIYVCKGGKSYFLFRLLGATNIWQVFKLANGPDESQHSDWTLFQYRFRAVKMKVVFWLVSDEIWRFCASLCKMKLLLSLNPLKVTTHNVWICHLKRMKPDGTTLRCLLRAILSSALLPYFTTHPILQRLRLLSITLTNLQNR